MPCDAPLLSLHVVVVMVVVATILSPMDNRPGVITLDQSGTPAISYLAIRGSIFVPPPILNGLPTQSTDHLVCSTVGKNIRAWGT
jgi:hypothetical protein